MMNPPPQNRSTDPTTGSTSARPPLAYLEAYPFPACVFRLHVPVIVADTDARPSYLLEWANVHWRGVSSVVDKDEGFWKWLAGPGQRSYELDQPQGKVHLAAVAQSDQEGGRHIIVTSIIAMSGKAKAGQSVPSPGLATHLESPLSMADPLTDCKALLATTNWAKTSLGPRASWPPVLEHMIQIIMSSPTQDSLWVGPDFNMIYNQQYTHITQHPRMFGQSANSKEAWGPVWDSVWTLIDRCVNHFEACHRIDDLLLYHRGPRGHYEERYHTWSFIPIVDDRTGKAIGMFNPTFETTASVLARRRHDTTRDVSERVLESRSMSEFFTGLAKVLGGNPTDIPFALCFSVQEAGKGEADVVLESSVGVPDDHPAAPLRSRVHILRGRTSSDHSAFAREHRIPSPAPSGSSSSVSMTRIVPSSGGATNSWPIAQALATRQCVLVEDCSTLIKGFPLRCWDSLPEQAIVVPVSIEGSTETPRAVLVLGVNLLCRLDATYEEWILVMRAHLGSALGSVRSHENEAQQLREREKMERAKAAWFQGAAHDLRSPLTLVVAPLADVLDTELQPQQRRLIAMANRNLQRMQRLVNSLLDFSRIEAGRLEGKFVPLDLGRFVADLAEIFRPATERRGIAFSVDIESREDHVVVDPALLETAVTNLLSNALKYTERGSISIRVAYEGTYVDIAIIDTGFGIPRAEIAQVTDHFHRATTALSRGAEGTGIGLALAKEIMRLHGGSLIIESCTAEESGGAHGSTFTARLPLTDREASGVAMSGIGSYGRAVAEEAMQWGSFDSDTGSEATASRGDGLLFAPTDVILLADDNADIRRYIKQLFAPFCTVIEATDGRDALAKAIATPPDLIISDLMMPFMTGHELLVAIRAHPLTRRVPVILLSAATDDELRVQGIMAGAEDFLLKPFKPKELLVRANLHMQVGKRRIELEALFEQREKEMTLLSENCPSGIIRADSHGQIMYGNKAWRDQMQMHPDDDVTSWTSYIDDETRARILAQWETIVRGEVDEMEMSWRWRSGTVVSGRFVRLDKAYPGMPGIIGCLSDITHQEERLVEAENRRLEAEESKRQQELLVDTTSHEIRTPVSAILQCASVAKTNMVHLAMRMTRAAESGQGVMPTREEMAELNEDIHALDTFTTSRSTLWPKPARCVACSTELTPLIISIFATEAKMKDITLSLDIGPTLARSSSRVLTDPVRLGQVFTNLVTNAIRFTSTSKVRRITLGVDVRLERPQGAGCWDKEETGAGQTLEPGAELWLVARVKDTGPGLTEKERDGLFQRFSQGNQMIHTRYGGSGLGLFICKSIVELLSGQITVESQIGVGSEFRFCVQCHAGTRTHTSSSPNDGTDKGLRSASSTVLPTVANGALPGRGLSVLIVEDNLINQTVLRRQMTKSGFTCDVASNGLEALGQMYGTARKWDVGASQPSSPQMGHPEIRGNGTGIEESVSVERAMTSYDVVLMDVEMPVMDGLTAVKHIRQQELDAEKGGARQLVIALTGNARQGQITQAVEAGMDHVVIKPYKLPQLVKTILDALDGRERARTGAQR